MFVFQLARDWKCAAKSTRDRLKKNEMDVLAWPSQIADLNPLENLWKKLVKTTKKKNIKNNN